MTIDVKFLKPCAVDSGSGYCARYNAGEVASIDERNAKILIERGSAVLAPRLVAAQKLETR